MNPSASSCFFALRPEPSLRQHWYGFARRIAGDEAATRLLCADHYHLSLQFLGRGLSAAEEAAACQAAGAVRGAAFDLVLDRLGAFRQGRESIVWLGPAQAPAALLRLHCALGEHLSSVGLATQEDRAFRPHLSLLRARGRWAPLAPPPLVWRIECFQLIRSVPSAGRRRYEWLGSWPLRA